MSQNIKKQVLEKLIYILDNRIEESKIALKAAKDSRDSETKSSVGDKYETGRAMVQIEIGKYQDQLEKSLKLKNAVAQIEPEKKSSSVDFGSLVVTNHGKYMVSVGLGVIEVDKEKYFAISLASPLGKELDGKRVGDKLVFQGREIEIVEIK